MAQNFIPSARKGIFAAAVVFIIGLVGCISIPLGDPEKAKVDESLFGAWVTTPNEDGEQTLFTVIGYDNRTALVSQIVFKKDAERIKASRQFDWKMWLVTINDATFISLELKNPQLALEPQEKRFACAKITRSGDSITMQLVKPPFVDSAKITTSSQLEDLITANLNNPDMYGEELVMTRVSGAQKDEVAKVLEALNSATP